MSKLRKFLSPQASPFRPYRHEIATQLHSILKPGDILLRDGQHYVSGVLPFSWFVQWLTQSKYAHSSLVYQNNGEPLIADVSDVGLRRLFLIDWLDDVYGKDFLVIRYNGSIPFCGNKVCQRAKEFIRQDPFYNVNLNLFDTETLYCVQFIYECYKYAGVDLASPIALKNLPNWNIWCRLVNKVFKYPTDQPMYFVGNKNIGLISSTCFDIVCKVSWKNLEKGEGLDLLCVPKQQTKQIEPYQSYYYVEKNLIQT